MQGRSALTAAGKSSHSSREVRKQGNCAKLLAGPPGTNYAVMRKAFEEGWGAVIAKTVSMDCSKVALWRLNTFVAKTCNEVSARV